LSERGGVGLRIYKSAWFAKFARKERISDGELCEAVNRAEQGLIDADLGSGLFKQRVARKGEGRSGGYRTLIFFRKADRAIFAFGFAKSDQANLSALELAGYRNAAKEYLAFSQRQIDAQLEIKSLIEVTDDDEDL
jgi:hypothetical protein